MIELFLLVYGLLVWLVFFKLKLLPWNEVSAITTMLIAVVVLLSFFGAMAYFQPLAEDGRFYVVTTPIVPKVRGRVIEVPVEPEVPLEAGDVLMRIDDTDYVAIGEVVEAELGLANQRLAEARTLVERQAGSRFDLERCAAEVAKLEAELDKARADVEATTVRAPTDGMVTQLMVQPGAMAVPFQVTPMMVFVHTEKRYFAASFKQNVIRHIDPGDEVEAALEALPGHVFSGRVKAVMPAIGLGQLAPTGTLRTPQTLPSGRIPILIDLEQDLSFLPAGVVGQVTVYTGESHVTEIVRRIILRMNSWLNYIPFEIQLH